MSKIDTILKNYRIQKIEENIKKDFYIDSYDLLSIIKGWSDYLEKGYEYIFSEKSEEVRLRLLTYSYIYYNWLNYSDIKLLPPHEDEFLSIFSRELRERIKDRYRFIISQIDEIISRLLKNLKDIDQKDYVYLFVSTYLCDEIDLIERYKQIEKRLTLMDNGYDIKELSNQDIFHDIRKELDRVRPDKIGKSNLTDAFSLMILQQKITDYNNGKGDLPIFYTSAEAILETIKHVQLKNKSFLSYFLDGEYFSIVRNNSYFTLDFIFNPNDEIYEKFFDEINNMRNIVNELHSNVIFSSKDNILSNETENFEKDADEFIKNKLFKELWSKEGKEVLHKRISHNLASIQESLHERKLLYEKHINDFDDSLVSDRLKRVKLFNETINTVYDIHKKNKYKTPASNQIEPVRVFRDFALTKFSFQRKLGPDIQEVVNKLISPIEYENDRGRFDTLSYLSEGISKKNIDSLCKGLSILWMYEKYDLINSICDYLIERDYNRYSIGIMHASAKLYCGSKKVDAARNIIYRIERYANNNPNYKIWVGLSFLYFQLWAEVSEINNVVELLPKGKNLESISSEVAEYHAKSLEYAKKAIAWLSKNKDIVTDEDIERIQMDKETIIRSKNRKYFYALNIYLYYASRGLNSFEFNSDYLEIIYDELSGGIFNPSAWQKRFYDTLSLFNVRKAMSASKEVEFSLYLDIAEDFNGRALNDFYITKREYDIYDYRKKTIQLIKTWGYKKTMIKKKSKSDTALI